MGHRQEALEREPPCDDPFWETEVKPLFEFLSSPRTLKELFSWGRMRYTQMHIRQMLAWLSVMDRIDFDGRTGKWVKL